MSKSKKQSLKDVKTPAQIKARDFKLLIYPDNPIHRTAFCNILLNYPESTIFCEHRKPMNPENYLFPSEKTHIHALIYLDNPKWWLAFCKEVGFVDDEGDPDTRFLRPLRWDDARERVETYLPYLTHTGQPDKEPYNDSTDLVWGSNKLHEMYQRACNGLLERNVRTSDSCIECLAWIKNQDRYIEFEDFALWACMNTNYKGAASPVIREAIKSHNQRFLHSRDNENGALMAEIACLHDQVAELKRKQVVINVNDFEPLDNVGGGIF